MQGLAVCGRCGRKLAVHYNRGYSTPGYHCHGRNLAEGRAQRCLSIGGIQIDQAVVEAFLAALTPAGVEAALAAAEALAADRDSALAQWRKEVERARYQAGLAERRYMAVDPDNRLVARGLEADWETKLAALAAAETELARRQAARPAGVGPDERTTLKRLGSDLETVWQAPTTTDRDRKELLRTLLEEVVIDVDRDVGQARLTLRWRGGALSELRVTLKAKQPTIRTDEDTIDLIRRLACHHPDATIAGTLNRQGRLSARGQRFTASMVQGLRYHWGIPRYQPPTQPPQGEAVPLYQAAKQLGVVPSTLYRWINEGFIPAEQDTPGAPWRIKMTDELNALFVDDSPPDWLAMLEATMALGVSRQTILQRVTRRAPSGHRPLRTQKRPKNKGSRAQPDPVQSQPINQGGSMNRIPRTPGCHNRSPSRAPNNAAGRRPPRPGRTARSGSRGCRDGRSAPACLPAASLLRSGPPGRPRSALRGPGPRPMIFRYLHRPHRPREVAPRAHPVPQLVEVVPPPLAEHGHTDGVHARRPLVGPDPRPRLEDEALFDVKRLALGRLRSLRRLLPHRVGLRSI